jgi:uncharacterized membrane protein
MKNLLRSAVVTATVTAGALATTVSPTSAATSYAADECSSSGNAYCFSLHYNSRSETTNYSVSSCFVTNESIPNYYGYSPNGASLVRYVFEYGQISGNYNTCRLGNSGEGLEVKNNAASASNSECVATHRVYYSSGYQGLSQAFSPTCGDYWPAQNLVSGLKNENASSKRT